MLTASRLAIISNLRIAQHSSRLSASVSARIRHSPGIYTHGNYGVQLIHTNKSQWISNKEKVISSSKVAPPSCPSPPPPSSSDGKSNTAYIVGAVVALAAGGIGAAYKFGLFESDKSTDEQKPPQQLSHSKPKAFPPSSKDLPKEVPYLLIGGGTASFAAFRAIKGHDAKAKVLVITDEPEMPYMRTPLSKELWFTAATTPDRVETEPLKFRQWNGVERSIYYEPEDFYIDPRQLAEAPNGGVAIARGYEVQRIDVVNRRAILTDGTEITYGECLLATGAKPKNLPVFEAAPLAVREHLTLFKGVHDFEALSARLKDGGKVAIIGGGFLGSELACSLSKYGELRGKQLEVFQLFHEDGNMGKILPEYLSQWTTERLREEGVKVWPRTQIKEATVQGNKLVLTLIDDSRLLVDHAVVAVGSEPNTDLAKTSGLEVDPQLGGFVVDAELRARSHLYVAGDAACFYDPKLGRRRIEHHDHAVVSGRLAGENMAGKNKPYTHQSMFWSDLGPKIGYEAIGIIDSSLPTVAVFAKTAVDAAAGLAASEKLQLASANVALASSSSSSNSSSGSGDTSVLNRTSIQKAEESTASQQQPTPSPEEEEDDFNKGVIFYLRDEKVVGVLLWNVFNRMGTARKIVSQNTTYDDLNEVAKLFNLHGRPEEPEEED